MQHPLNHILLKCTKGCALLIWLLESGDTKQAFGYARDDMPPCQLIALQCQNGPQMALYDTCADVKNP